MDKKTLQDIISKGFVARQATRAVLYYEGRNLVCEFLADDKTYICRIVADKFNDGNNFIGDQKIGLPDVGAFIKMLKTMGDDVNIELEKRSTREQYLILDDGTMQMRYGLIAKSQLPKSFRLKLPIRECTIYIDKEFINRVYKLIASIKDCKYVFMSVESGMFKVIFSQSEDYDTGAMLEQPVLESDCFVDFPSMKFGAKQFKAVMYNNRKATQGRIQFTDDGRVSITQFVYEDHGVTAYIIAENYY